MNNNHIANELQGQQSKAGGKLKYLVILDYHSAYPDPFILRAGDLLKVEDKKCEYGEWLWCTTQQGKSGWVPEPYLKRQGDNGTLLCDYDATELTVKAGDELLVNKKVCDWFWCTNSEGKTGWVPAKCVERL